MSDESRIETMLRNILGETDELPMPVSRIEKMLANMCGGTFDIDQPVSRIEQYILQILENGGGGGGSKNPIAEDNDVIFIDYDGTILYSYTAEEFLALTEMPANPEHDGLIAEGWNWTLTDAKEFVRYSGSHVIGQLYTTSSGATEIDVKITYPRNNPYLGLAVNGSLTIDWGDGSTEVVTGTSEYTTQYIGHVYPAHDGYYTIKLTGINFMLGGGSPTGFSILYSGADRSATSITNAYSAGVDAIRCGAGMILGSTTYMASLRYIAISKDTKAYSIAKFGYSYALFAIVIPDGFFNNGVLNGDAFRSSTALEYVSFPKTIESNTGSPSAPFRGCTALKKASFFSGGSEELRDTRSVTNVVFKRGLKTIASSFANYAYGVSRVVIPDTVTSIASSAFQNCYGCGMIRFLGATPPTVANANTFNNLPVDCVIEVPAGTLATYTSAANYPSASTYTYREFT